MNKLTTKQQQTLPNPVRNVLKAWKTFNQVETFQDIENLFLRGQGLSGYTYRNYRLAFKRFYEFTEGKHPLQVNPADLELFYDHRAKQVDRNTVYGEIRGIKKCFEGMRTIVPGFCSPFDNLPEKLHKKLNRTKSGAIKGVMSKTEMSRLLDHLKGNKTLLGVENYAIVYLLYVTGLRGTELCNLRWRDIEYEEDEGRYYALGIGKGEKPFHQEIADPKAVELARAYFVRAFGWDPGPEDHLFWTIPGYKFTGSLPMRYHVLYDRIKNIGKAAKELGIIKRNLNLTPHVFRRSIITHLYKNGMRIKALRNFSRHSSIETLIKHYVDDQEPAAKYFKLPA